MSNEARIYAALAALDTMADQVKAQTDYIRELVNETRVPTSDPSWPMKPPMNNSAFPVTPIEDLRDSFIGSGWKEIPHPEVIEDIDGLPECTDPEPVNDEPGPLMLYTVEQAAGISKVSINFVRALLAANKIPRIQPGGYRSAIRLDTAGIEAIKAQVEWLRNNPTERSRRKDA